MNKQIINNYSEIEYLIKENRNLIEIVHGYCENNLGNGCDTGTLLTALEIIKHRQEELGVKMDESNTNLYHKFLS